MQMAKEKSHKFHLNEGECKKKNRKISICR